MKKAIKYSFTAALLAVTLTAHQAYSAEEPNAGALQYLQEQRKELVADQEKAQVLQLALEEATKKHEALGVPIAISLSAMGLSSVAGGVAGASVLGGLEPYQHLGTTHAEQAKKLLKFRNYRKYTLVISGVVMLAAAVDISSNMPAITLTGAEVDNLTAKLNAVVINFQKRQIGIEAVEKSLTSK